MKTGKMIKLVNHFYKRTSSYMFDKIINSPLFIVVHSKYFRMNPNQRIATNPNQIFTTSPIPRKTKAVF